MNRLKTCLLLSSLLTSNCLLAEWIWIEGESSKSGTAKRHPWYHDAVKKELLSGGDFISHFDDSQAAQTTYEFVANQAGEYDFWMRVNPIQAKLSVEINGGTKRPVDLKGAKDPLNIASDGKPDLRFQSWVEAGRVSLKKGANRIVFHFESDKHFHGAMDCFILTNEGFTPQGMLKPDQVAAHRKKQAQANVGWTPWEPGKDEFGESAIDLRKLNEAFAGEHGPIIAKGERLVRSADGQQIRFWAVNGPPDNLSGRDLAHCARMLAKHGVNMVRMHGAVFDGKTGELNPARIRRIRESVSAMKKEGIYSHLSFYFPLWLKPTNGPGWRQGYDGTMPTFALPYFEPEFQKLYRSWIHALLSAKDTDGLSLAADPAVAGVELVNEDSFFFWTFDYGKIPEPQMAKLERLFGIWAGHKYGDINSALAKWKTRHKRDLPDRGALGFRPLYSMFSEKTLRDQDTAQFLFETQRDFYSKHIKYVRSLGFKGLITASNWTTANNEVFGPLEKSSYAAGDIIDRHGYFGTNHSGDNAAWSIREGHVYSDRSALTFDGEKPGSKKNLSHPAMDLMTNLKPSMISETTWNRPNRYRGEAPLYYAVIGALQGTDAIVHFALDGVDWSVKPQFFMQPWTLMSPTQMGQFPAAALIYRNALVSEGSLVASLPISLKDAFALKGTKLSQKANLDLLRESDVKNTAAVQDGMDPLIHYVGKTNLAIDQADFKAVITDLTKHIDRGNQTVTSISGESRLDYGIGLLTIRAAAAQGASGNLKKAGIIDLPDLTIESDLDTGHVILVSLDGKPLKASARMLLQVMTEEKPTGFETEDAGNGILKITRLGENPWLIKEPRGKVRLKRDNAAKLTVTALDLNGYTVRDAGPGGEIRLDPKTVYYLLQER